MFDAPVEAKQRRAWDVSLPIEGRPWRIGAIVGASGTGKTTVGRVLFGDQAYHEGFVWDQAHSILDAFPPSMETRTITKMLSSVGFASPPAWMRPYRSLSNGEQFRAELARLLLDDRALVVIDEFTSVVNRQVAKVGSAAVAKALRRMEGKQLVVLSCHDDILEWLAPDWIFDMNTVEFRWAQLHRPSIDIEVRRCPRSLWSMFAHHHYLSATLHPAAACYAGLIDRAPVAFVGVLPVIGLRGAFRVSRAVTLPDYQGIGVMRAVGDAVASLYHAQGKRYFLRTSHPAQVAALQRSPSWTCRAADRLGRRPHSGAQRGVTTSAGRVSVGFEYTPFAS